MWHKGELPKGPCGEMSKTHVPTATPINPEQLAMPARRHVLSCSVICTRNAINPCASAQHQLECTSSSGSYSCVQSTCTEQAARQLHALPVAPFDGKELCSTLEMLRNFKKK